MSTFNIQPMTDSFSSGVSAAGAKLTAETLTGGNSYFWKIRVQMPPLPIGTRCTLYASTQTAAGPTGYEIIPMADNMIKNFPVSGLGAVLSIYATYGLPGYPEIGFVAPIQGTGSTSQLLWAPGANQAGAPQPSITISVMTGLGGGHKI
jgi:hypothetical protein